MVLKGAFPGMGEDGQVAAVGVAEKGYLTINLTVEVSPDGRGHSSLPPKNTVIGILAK